MNIIKFIEEFPDDASCRAHFKAAREKEGIICKKCKSKRHFWLKGKEMWQCADCNFRTTLRSGSMMEGAKLPIRTWYLAMSFMSFSKKGISAVELQKQLNHSRYESIWSMMHKIRKAMGNRDLKYKLQDSIELDEGYFQVEVSEEVKNNLKRGRGSQQKQNVAVMAESTPLEDIETGEKTSHVRFFKMKVLDNHLAGGINEAFNENIDDLSIVFSDNSTSYIDIKHLVEVHVIEKSSKETTKTTLKWVHIAISNAKRTLLGIYHKIKGKYLQAYLDEFCYKLNRRYFKENLFDRLVVALTNQNWQTNG